MNGANGRAHGSRWGTRAGGCLVDRDEDVEALGLLEDETTDGVGSSDEPKSKEYNAWLEAIKAMELAADDDATCHPCEGALEIVELVAATSNPLVTLSSYLSNALAMP